MFDGIFGYFLWRACIIQAALGVLLLAVLLPYFDYAARELAAEQGRTVASSTLSATSDALYEENYPAVVDYCLNLIKATPNVRFVTFSRQDGQELVVEEGQWAMKSQSLPYFQPAFALPEKPFQAKPYQLKHNGISLGFSDHYEFSESIILANKQWGVLTISFSTAEYRRSIRTFNWVVLFFTIFSGALFLGLFLYSSKRIRNQIDGFTGVAKRLAQGDLSARAEEKAIGEIAVLGKAINNMSAALLEKTDRIEQLAYYDALTDLPNRRLLLDRLNRALVASDRNGRWGALLYMDLDNFKNLNDTLGHATGDELLRQVGVRLLACVRAEDTVVRLGGDEFVVMLEDLSTDSLDAAAQVEVIGKKILSTLNQPYLLEERSFSNTPSVGITLFNGNERSVEELLKHADIAMYQAKQQGRNTIRFFDPKMQQQIDYRAALEEDLRVALTLEQFRLHYQMQVDSFGTVIGAEALIRWEHPTRGLVSPAEFIPLSEEIGTIHPIGHWVINTACAQLAKWQANELTRSLKLSVNVSAKQFHDARLLDHVAAAIKTHSIAPGRLELELTESVLLQDVDATVRVMNQLNAMGIEFAMDDFGTGYSSLQYLKKLPLTQLKIDQSFVRDIASDESDLAIVKTIIAMAKSMNFGVIAEGVELPEQLSLLKQAGCLQFQGYLFSKPLPIELFEALIKSTANSFDMEGLPRLGDSFEVSSVSGAHQV